MGGQEGSSENKALGRWEHEAVPVPAGLMEVLISLTARDTDWWSRGPRSTFAPKNTKLMLTMVERGSCKPLYNDYANYHHHPAVHAHLRRKHLALPADSSYARGAAERF